LLSFTDLARQYLDALSIGGLAEVEVYACGPHPMLEAVAVLAKEYALPCQVSLEDCLLYIRGALGFANGNQSYDLSVINLVNPRLNAC
jgi:NAD(P)H-flavin reductase